MRPHYTMPAAMGRIARVGYSKKNEEDITPLGGNFFYYPDRTGIGSWTVPYTVTTGNLFVRLLYQHDSGASSAIRVYFNGVELTRNTVWYAAANKKLGAATYGGRGFPLGAGTITLTNVGGEAGLAIMRIGELRSFTSIGAATSYGADANVSAVQISIKTTPGNDISLVAGVAGPVNSAIGPVSMLPYFQSSTNAPVIYPQSVEITEVVSTDGESRVVGLFGASTTQTLPYPSMYEGTQLVFRWNSPDPDFSYATSAMEVIGSVP